MSSIRENDDHTDVAYSPVAEPQQPSAKAISLPEDLLR